MESPQRWDWCCASELDEISVCNCSVPSNVDKFPTVLGRLKKWEETTVNYSCVPLNAWTLLTVKWPWCSVETWNSLFCAGFLLDSHFVTEDCLSPWCRSYCYFLFFTSEKKVPFLSQANPYISQQNRVLCRINPCGWWWVHPEHFMFAGRSSPNQVYNVEMDESVAAKTDSNPFQWVEKRQPDI